MPISRRRHKCGRTDIPMPSYPRACIESRRIPRNIILRNSRRRTICLSRPQCCSNSSSSLSLCQEDNEDEYCTRKSCDPVKCSASNHGYRRRTTISSTDLNRPSNTSVPRTNSDTNIRTSIANQNGCENPRPVCGQTQTNQPPQPCKVCKTIIEDILKACEICKNNPNRYEDCSFCKSLRENVLKDCDVCKLTCFVPPSSCLPFRCPSKTRCGSPPPSFPPPKCPSTTRCRLPPPSSFVPKFPLITHCDSSLPLSLPPKCPSTTRCGSPSPLCLPPKPPISIPPCCLLPKFPSITRCGPSPPSCLPPRGPSITCCSPLPSCPPSCSPMDCPHAIPLSVTCHLCKKEKEKAQKCVHITDSDDKTCGVESCPHAVPPPACLICCKKPELPAPLPIECKISVCMHAKAIDECVICCNKVSNCDKLMQTCELLPYPTAESKDCPTTTTCTCKIPPAYSQLLTPSCTSNIKGSLDCGK